MGEPKTRATVIMSQRLAGLVPEFGRQFGRMSHSSLWASMPAAPQPAVDSDNPEVPQVGGRPIETFKTASATCPITVLVGHVHSLCTLRQRHFNRIAGIRSVSPCFPLWIGTKHRLEIGCDVGVDAFALQRNGHGLERCQFDLDVYVFSTSGKNMQSPIVPEHDLLDPTQKLQSVRTFI